MCMYSEKVCISFNKWYLSVIGLLNVDACYNKIQIRSVNNHEWILYTHKPVSYVTFHQSFPK